MLARDYRIRVFIVFALYTLLFTIILIRLFLVQIYQKNFFKVLAQQQYELEITLNPPRAALYDANGRELVFNRELMSVFVVPHQLVEKEKTLTFLKHSYPDVYKRVIQSPEKQFVWVDRKLSPDKYERLVKLDLHDLHFIGESQRFYPLVGAAQLLGYTDIDNNGVAGVELGCTQLLSGRPKSVKFQKDARSGLYYFDKLVQVQGEKGASVSLTIESCLQERVFYELRKTVQDLKAINGSALVVDPSSGRVLAMATYPSFDPNKKGIVDLEAMKNNTVCECYEPGSVMKAFCAMAAFEDGTVGFDELIDCEGRYGYIDGVKIENPTLTLLRILAERNNILPFCDVLRYSSNVGIAKVAKRLNSRLYFHLRRLGFGSKTGIEFPGERSGFVNPPEHWTKPSLIVLSFGYEIMVTLSQMTKAFSVIANGGYDMKLRLLNSDLDSTNKARHKLYSDKTIEYMKTIMQSVCEKHQIPEFRIMGKTGTARCVKDGKYSNKHHTFTFGGIVEKGDYKRVIVTFIKEPEKASLWASEVALPLFHRIAESMIVYDKLHHKC